MKLANINPELCSRCKGRGFCGKKCPILSRLDTKTKKLTKKEFEGSSPPTVFIGSKLPYPKVNIGIMTLSERRFNTWIYDAPNYWSRKGFDNNKIISFRKNLINSRTKARVSDIRKNKKILKQLQEVGMASIQTDLEIKLDKKPKSQLHFDEKNIPMGPTAKLKELKFESNIKIPKKVEKVYYDDDWKSKEAIRHLYKKGLNEHALSQLLSIGITGLKKNRKLVPTRNSITAIDDLIGKNLLKEIRDCSPINEYRIHFGGHLGNYYLLLFFPDIFGYELFENKFPNSTWNPGNQICTMTDYESYEGRKNYAEETGGGYYAARLPILQYLHKISNQARVIALRFCLPEYNIPLGVWVCRNSVRKALNPEANIERKFESRKSMLEYAKKLAKKKFNFNINQNLDKSVLLKEIKTQFKLNRYF